ncbi:MAG: hypothetical protein WBO34_05295 [Gammaproteobacteria bacterium]
MINLILRSPCKIFATFFITLLIILPGCNVGGSGGAVIVANQNPMGLWDGTFTETGFGTGNLTGLLINGELFFISTDADSVHAGTYNVIYNSISGTADLYQINGALFGTSTLSGTVTTGASLTGNFSTSYGSIGTFNLAYDPVTDRGSSLATTNAVWSATNGLYTITLAIDINGMITGSDTDGCVYNGAGSIIDAGKNIYRVNITVTSCGVLNGTYDGYGSVLDNVIANDTLIYAVQNANYLLYGSLTRQ